MVPNVFVSLAQKGLRMPIGADLVLHETADPEGCKYDATRLGEVVARAARRYHTPLAFPLMDLTLEKADVLSHLGVPAADLELFHFDSPPSPEVLNDVLASAERPFLPRIQANQNAVRYVAAQSDLLAVGMLIGPFSLMTKLVADPIAGVALAGCGVTSEQDDAVCLVERCLVLAECTVLRSALAQIGAGARAIILCEPAANTVYLSPRQMSAGSDILERFVLAPNRRIRQLLGRHGVDLIFHNCGELNTELVRTFASELRPAVISLGSSRKLWEDAAVVPRDIVLFGNLPTRMFYSDSALPVEEVRRLTVELRRNMAASGHPHILGSECDVLHVPGAAETIRHKVDVMLTCDGGGHS